MSRHKHWLRRRSLEWLKLRRHLKARMGVLDPLRIDVYGGYAGTQWAMVWGRALENEVPSAPKATDRLLDNLRRSLRQLESDEVPELELSLRLAENSCHVVTDDEGYFVAELGLLEPLRPGWHPVRARVIDDSVELADGVTGVGNVLVPREEARFAVVSDIDDTILQSHVQNRFKQAYVTLLGNAVTRLSFQGASDLYRGLERAGRGAPFFYVSRSAWNIHATLEHFIEHQGLPKGPLVLRDVDLLNDIEKRRGHKRREIERLFATFPELPFILIGDSGQQDPFIYLDIAEAHPARVKAILIRDVSSAKRSEEVAEALKQRCPPGCTAMLFDDDSAAIRRCREKCLWLPDQAHNTAPAIASRYDSTMSG